MLGDAAGVREVASGVRPGVLLKVACSPIVLPFFVPSIVPVLPTLLPTLLHFLEELHHSRHTRLFHVSCLPISCSSGCWGVCAACWLADLHGVRRGML